MTAAAWDGRWPTVELGDVATSRLGKMLSPASKAGGEEFPYVGNAEVRWGRIETSNLRTMSFTPAEQAEFALERGDVLVCEGGEAGRTAVVEEDLPGIYFQKAIHRVRCSERLDPRFLYRYMRFASDRKALSDLSSQATIMHLTGVKLRRVPIPLPPIEEQRRIAAVLDKADEVRSKRRDALALLDTLTESIFYDMFGDPALNPRRWASTSLESLADGRDGIKCGPFGTQLGQAEYQESGVPLWGIRQVNRNFEIETEEFLTEDKARSLDAYRLTGGDVVMTRKGTVGNCALYPWSYPDGLMHSDLLRVRLGPLADPTFMATQLRYSREVTRQIALISGGAIMPGINVTKLKEVQVLVPPLSLQQEFVERVSAVGGVSHGVRSASGRVDDLFLSLQQRAFRGEL